MTTDKRGVSALLLQRQLGLRRYETAWMMLHKLRQAMVNLDARAAARGSGSGRHLDWRYPSGFAGKPTTEGPEGRPHRGGGGEAWPRDRARSHGGHPGFQKRTLIAFLRQNVAPGSLVYTDGLKSFTGLEEAGFRHVPRTQPSRTDLHKGAKSAVPLADRAIGNLKQWLLGTHHGVGRDQLQAYLDEFVFRHNRRKQPMAAFQTLLGLGTGHKPTTYKQMRSGRPFQAAQPRPDPNILWLAETTG